MDLELKVSSSEETLHAGEAEQLGLHAELERPGLTRRLHWSGVRGQCLQE